eukprot:1895912-Pleurochrysis_carterae.AAC.1
MSALSSSGSALRDLGARCLSEFVRYSIKHKHATSRDSPQNVRALLQRLFGLAQHPSALRRLSFALAVKAAYRALREDLESIELFLLELLQKSVHALRLSEADPPSLGSADALCEVVTHLEKVLLRCLLRLCKPREDREMFQQGLIGEHGFMQWLFEACVADGARARLRCTQLLERICSQLPRDAEADPVVMYGSSRAWVKATYKTSQLPILARVHARSSEMVLSANHRNGGEAGGRSGTG